MLHTRKLEAGTASLRNFEYVKDEDVFVTPEEVFVFK
jgi:hypothetical protein